MRKFLRGEISDHDAALSALRVIEQHRGAHQKPLVHANNGVRSMVRTLGCGGQVTQRLKRMSTILEKLERESSLSLDKMQDIGGCRAVLTSLDDLWRLRDRIVRYHPEAKQYDYVTTPRSSGYRAVHLVVVYGSEEPTPIEIQLRSFHMHSWAMLVESYSGATGINYKRDGHSDFQEMAQALSQVFALREVGQEVPQDLMEHYTRLQFKVFPPRQER
jgi:putative GTP pyrophosphokinase